MPIRAQLLSALTVLLAGMLIGNLVAANVAVSTFRRSCALSEGTTGSTQLRAACDENARGATVAASIKENGFGSLGMPWYAYAVFAVAVVGAFMAPETLGWMLCVAVVGMMGCGLAWYAPQHTSAAISAALSSGA